LPPPTTIKDPPITPVACVSSSMCSGESMSVSLTSTISPESGAMMSATALTDSSSA
jgi:hypothetical protein